MKKIFSVCIFLFAFSFLLSGGNGKGDTEKFLAEKGIILTYPGWKLKALSFSYDDGNIADRRLVGIFNKYGMKGTFHIPSAWLKKKPAKRVTEKEIMPLYVSCGHEISGHGANHLSMAKLKKEKLQQEIEEEIREWKRITNKKILGYAYPYGSCSNTVIAQMRKRGLLYGRTVGKRNDFKLPVNFMRWAAQGHHTHNIARLGDNFLAYKAQKMSILLIWGHSYEFPKANNWHVMENFCKKMSGKKDIFYAAMGEIASYVIACRDLKISSDRKKVTNLSGKKIYYIKDGKNHILENGKSLAF